jgi:hypothetical protein
MDNKPDTRGCRGPDHRLRGAAGRVCAGVSRSAGLRGPAALSACAGLPGPTGSRASASPADPADRRRGTLGASAGSGRSHSGRSRPLLRLDSRLLFLERRLDMDQRPLCCSAQAHCYLGRRPLGPTWPQLYLDWRRLAVVPVKPQRRWCGHYAACPRRAAQNHLPATRQ